MEDSIATAVTRCLSMLRAVVQDEDGWAQGQVPVSRVQDELSRFKIWAGNSGAHHTGRRSLEHRLRDASHLRGQVLRLLGDLVELLDDARAILAGEQVPWDRLPRDDDDDDDGNGSDGEEDEPGMPSTELAQILRNIADIISYLARLAVAIRNPAPHDRFRASRATDTSYTEPYDIQHVREKFHGIDDIVAVRLGRAISYRRQYFKYREAHHARLSEGLEFDTNKTAATPISTVASSLPDALMNNTAFDVNALDDDDMQSDAGLSQTSYAALTMNADALHVPSLPKEAMDGPFECPFCYMMILARTRVAWKKHVFRDLRPYVCLNKDCAAPSQDFARRSEWMGHMKQHHWKTWKCQAVGCRGAFDSTQDCHTHLANVHSGVFSASQMDAAVKMCERPTDLKNGVACPICGLLLKSVQHYQRHVGSEQMELSLFALPNVGLEDDASDSDSDSSHSKGKQADVSSVLDDWDEDDSDASSRHADGRATEREISTAFAPVLEYLVSVHEDDTTVPGPAISPPPDELDDIDRLETPKNAEIIHGPTIEQEVITNYTNNFSPLDELDDIERLEAPEDAEIIHGPTIEREVITHYTDIDHGVVHLQPHSNPDEPEPTGDQDNRHSLETEDEPALGEDSHRYDRMAGGGWSTTLRLDQVSPEALTLGKENFDIGSAGDVTVDRTLSPEEIQAYIIATNQLREQAVNLGSSSSQPADNSGASSNNSEEVQIQAAAAAADSQPETAAKKEAAEKRLDEDEEPRRVEEAQNAEDGGEQEANEAVPQATRESEEEPIKFKDAVGRKFNFPYRLCRTWPNMKEIIQQAFLQVDVIGPCVMAGQYDLVTSDGSIILPSNWDKMVQPGWSISMHMWPPDKQPGDFDGVRTGGSTGWSEGPQGPKGRTRAKKLRKVEQRAQKRRVVEEAAMMEAILEGAQKTLAESRKKQEAGGGHNSVAANRPFFFLGEELGEENGDLGRGPSFS